MKRNEEHDRAHHFCKVCGEPLLDGRQNAHFDCMLNRWREGDRSDRIKRFSSTKGIRSKRLNN